MGTVDGKFGLLTRAAVIAFQKARGLKTDGLAGTKTLELLYNAANSSTPSSSSSSSSSSPLSRSLRRGSSGNDVLAVQTKLKELGYYSGSLDGDFGSGTLAAAKAFQRANSLTVDGVVGSSTYGKLFSSSSVSASSSSNSSNNTDSSTESLRLGSTGSAVIKMQQGLKALGYGVSAGRRVRRADTGCGDYVSEKQQPDGRRRRGHKNAGGALQRIRRQCERLFVLVVILIVQLLVVLHPPPTTGWIRRPPPRPLGTARLPTARLRGRTARRCAACTGIPR